MTGEPLYPMGPTVEIFIDGQSVQAREGEPIAAVFLRLDDIHTRTSYPSRKPRAPFCMMGVCFECLVHLESRGTVRSCQQAVTAGMKIDRYDYPKRLA